MSTTFDIPNYGYVPDYGLEKTKVALSKMDRRTSPGFNFTPEQAQVVENLTALGMSLEDVGATLRVDPKLLAVVYDYEIKTASARINATVAKTALGMAVSGANPDMTKFWLRTRAGWVETKRIEHTGMDGGPMEFSEVRQMVVQKLHDEMALTQGADGVYAPIDEPGYEQSKLPPKPIDVVAEKYPDDSENLTTQGNSSEADIPSTMPVGSDNSGPDA